MPELNKLLGKKKQSEVNKLESIKIDKKNAKKVISKEIDSITKPKSRSKGFGQTSSNANSRSKGYGETSS